MFEMKINGRTRGFDAPRVSVLCVWRWARVHVFLWLAVALVLLVWLLCWRFFRQFVV